MLNQASVETQVVTAQAFSKARSKLKPEVFESVNQALQQQLDSLGIRQAASFFGSHCEFPVACLSMLYDVADGQT